MYVMMPVQNHNSKHAQLQRQTHHVPRYRQCKWNMANLEGEKKEKASVPACPRGFQIEGGCASRIVGSHTATFQSIGGFP